MRAKRLLLTLFSLLMIGISSIPSALGQEGTPDPAITDAVSLEGRLVITSTLPEDGAGDVPVDQPITVIFNRPMVPLGTSETMASFPSPITFTPDVEGTGEWINTSIYQFTPSIALAAGTQYTVAAVPNLTAIDGATLPEGGAQFTFSTGLPAVVEVLPRADARGVELAASVQITFNVPVDRAAFEAAFSLIPVRVEEEIGLCCGKLQAATGDEDVFEPVSGTFEWAEDSLGVRFVPDELLNLGTTYSAQIAANGLVGAGGGKALDEEVSWEFTTVRLPGVVRTDPFPGAENVEPYGGFTFYFSSPMNIESLEDRVVVEPEPWRDYDRYYNSYDYSYTVSFPTEPSTDYTITLLPGAEDIYGNAIEEAFVAEYSTAPYPSSVSIRAPGNVGFYNAYNEQTQVFITHRNIDEIEVALYSLDMRQLRDVLSDRYDDNLNLVLDDATLLREWTIPNVAPQNALRYELLSLMPGEGAEDCPAAPPTRLNVGDVAVVVVAEGDTLRARANPPDGEILELLEPGVTLPIVGGPTCANNLLWWEVTLPDEQTGWVAEAITGEYFLDVETDTPEATPIPVDVAIGGPNGEGEALPPGVYALTLEAPEPNGERLQTGRHTLVVATANLTFKQGGDELLIWATDVQTGEPVADAPIVLYTIPTREYSDTGELLPLSEAMSEPLGSGTTDADGVLRFALPPATNLYSRRYIAVLGESGSEMFGIGYSDWRDGIEPYSFGVSSAYQAPRAYTTYLYTDRPLYRPGQPVYFRGVMRQQDDVTFTPPDATEAPIAIYNDQGEIIFEDVLPMTDFGTFSGTFNLGDDASLGYYRIVVQEPDQAGFDEWQGSQVQFGVAEYRAPEFQTTVTAPGEVVQGDTIEAQVESRYFFGGAVSDASAEVNVISEPYFFDYEGSGRYQFYDADADTGSESFYYDPSQEAGTYEATLDASGRTVIEIPASLGEVMQSQQYTVEATVTDETGFAVSGRTQVIVHQAEVYVGVGIANYVGRAEEEQTANLIVVDWESNPVAGQAIAVQVVERRWSSVQEQDENGRTSWTYEVEDIPLLETTATTNEDGRATVTFTPPNGGIFKVYAEVEDANGNTATAADLQWVASGEYVAWRQTNSNRIDIIADQTEYAVGETASILLTSPFQGESEALITIERNNVLTTELVTLTSNSYVYELPITEDMAPNVYVSAFIVHGVDAANPVTGFRMGTVALLVDNSQKELTVTVTPDTEQAGPGDTVNYTVLVTDYAGNPVEAEVGVSLSDVATLTIAPPNTGTLLDFFYSAQPLGVLTSSPLTVNVDQTTQTILDTIKGGGGGFGEGGIFDIREEFVDTPYWNGSVVTDENGEATFSVELPDNLTTWRLDARAITSGDDGLTLVGQTTNDILSTKPVLIRPVTPRFFVVGDQVTLAAIVNNNTEDDLSTEVAIETVGVTLLDEATRIQTVDIAAGTRARVEWQVTADEVDAAELIFFANANGGEYTDASRPPLGQGDTRAIPIYRFEVEAITGTAGVLTGDDLSRTEAITLPPTVINGELDINVDHSLAATTINGLQALGNYRHQNIEQTISRFLPNILSTRALAMAGVELPELTADLDRVVNEGLQRLIAEQKVDGGWGWFVQDESNPLVTAYALIGLVEAEAAGYPVPENTLEAARTFVRGSLISPALLDFDWQFNRQAFLLYALARAGSPEAGRASTLYAVRERLDLYARALLALTLHEIAPDDSRISTLVSDIGGAAIITATGAHWEEAGRDSYNWNTNTRTTALALEMLLQVDPDNALIPNVVRWLVTTRSGDDWETTQETAWSLIALTNWLTLSNELNADYSYSVALNDAELAAETVTTVNVAAAQNLVVEVSDLVQNATNTLLFERTAGEGNLYYTAHLRAFIPVPEVEPLDNGIILQRVYTNEAGEVVTSAAVGETLQARLTIIVPNSLQYAVIEDPIPAGTDAVDPNLNTSQQIGTQPELNRENPLSQGWGWWWFSRTEFRDDRVVLYATYLPAGTYEFVYSVRAGLPGEYNVIPPTGYEFYFPEVYGRGAGSTFVISG